MTSLLLLILMLWSSAKPGIEQCYSDGKIYTIVRGVPVDSVDVALVKKRIETTKNVEQRIAEWDSVIAIITNHKCKF